LTSTTAFARTNFLRNVLTGQQGNTLGNGTYNADTTVQNATGTSIDWATWQGLAGNPAALVDKLSWVFAGGALSTSSQQQIVNAVNGIAATDPLTRAKTAAYLVLTSSQFQVDR
jgi:hypothetical protein